MQWIEHSNKATHTHDVCIWMNDESVMKLSVFEKSE